MSARYLQRKNNEEIILHIFNRGLLKEKIFRDAEDCEMFIRFLEEYLSPPVVSENRKKTFTIRGRSYKGVPHQPKNYYGSVELFAYGITPHNFNLALRQIAEKSVQGLLRSLCTRYSIYFNKKYKRTGPLLESPYKSVSIENNLNLLHLTRHIHRKSFGNESLFGDKCTSFGEYIGVRNTPWINSEKVLTSFSLADNAVFKQLGNYKNFVEKYTPFEPIEKMTIETFSKTNWEDAKLTDLVEEKITLPEKIVNEDLARLTRLQQFFVASAVFLLLAGLGFRNILVSSANNQVSDLTPTTISEVMGTQEETLSVDSNDPPKKDGESKIMLIVTIDESTVVNIRKYPTPGSEEVGEAKSGDIFEYVIKDQGWYGIKLEDGSTGFISEKYMQVVSEIEEVKVTKSI